MNTTTISADTSRKMAAELIRDIQQRNYGAAETKVRQLWDRLNEEALERWDTDKKNSETLRETARIMNRRTQDVFLKEMDYRINNLNNAQKTNHSEGMRAGFMYARAIYKGTRK